MKFTKKIKAITCLVAAVMFFQQSSVFVLAEDDSFWGSIGSSVSSLFRDEPEEVEAMREDTLLLSDGVHIEYYFTQLSEEQKKCYRQILNGVKNREESFYLSYSDNAIIDTAYHALMNDHPELFWIHNRESVYKTTYSNEDYCLFGPGYTYTDAEMAEIYSAMDNAYETINAAITADSTDYDKIKEIYAYLIDHVEYVSSEHDQNIAGALWKNQAVCAGYAQAVQYLAERFGIYSIYVEGDTVNSDEGHAWNIIMLDGQYYYVDATNGDQPQFLEGNAVALAEHKTIIYDYLCPFPWEYEKTYTPSTDFSLPECIATDENFYVLNDACFDYYDWQTIMNFCEMRLNNGAAVVRFKFSNEEAFQQAYTDWIENDSVKEVAQYYMNINGLYEVQYHYGILEQLNTMYFIF